MNILLVYSTTGGNTALVTERIARVLRDSQHDVTVQRVEDTISQQMMACDALLLGSPTYGHGQLELRWEQYIDQYSDVQLGGKPCAAYGLGDSKYDDDYTIEAATILHDWLGEHGGMPVCEPLRVHQTPVPVLDTLVTDWAKNLSANLS